MKFIRPILLFLAIILTPTISISQNNIQRYIESLKKDSLFINSITGIMVMNSNGKVIASWNEDMPMLTASTMKCVTTAIALKVLKPDYKFKTQLGYTGFIENGVLYGDLYIVGGADPTLGSFDSLAIPKDSLFLSWSNALTREGITRINGHIVADDRFFEDEIIPSSWSWGNLGPYYGSAASGLSFYENIQHLTLIPGKNIGDYTHIKEIFPQIPNMQYNNGVYTSGSNTPIRTSYRASNLSRVGSLSGSIPLNRDSSIITVSNKFPHLSCAMEFQKYLNNLKIYSLPDILDAKTIKSASLYELTIINETESAPIQSIVNVTNRISNNFYAETLFKMVAKKITGVGSYDSAKVAFNREMEDLTLGTFGYYQEDGSGLSRQNYISAKFMTNFFYKMKQLDIFESFYESLPHPGGEGTLKNVLAKVPYSEKSKIRAKSGSLSGVRCYSGYVNKGRGEYLTFTIFTNNFTAKTSEMQVGIEGFMNELLKYKN